MNDGIKEEAYKCSKCGLCKSVCPIYLATKNEMYLPRGRFIVLNNFFNNGIKPSKEFYKNLDICLNCNLCKDFCPSNIDSAKIFTELKKQSKSLYFKLFLIFSFSKLFNNFKKYKPIKNTDKEKVIYFEGCYNNYIDCADRNSSIKLIEELGYEVNVVSDCCGYIYLSNNDKKAFVENEKKIIKNCAQDGKYIVCSCDSCYETLKNLTDKTLVSKLIRLDEFLKENNYQFKQNSNAVYFKPLIKKENSQIEECFAVSNKKGACSLMENFFSIKHNKLAKKIAKNGEEYAGKEVVTTCNITKLGLIRNYKAKAVSYSQWLKKVVD